MVGCIVTSETLERGAKADQPHLPQYRLEVSGRSRNVCLMAEPPIPDETITPLAQPGDGSGSALCTHCGLCCMGVIHYTVALHADEIEGARLIGLPVRDAAKPGFSLPCPKFEGSLCTIYEDRPQACRRYRCQLLQDFEGGAISFEEAIGHVDMAKELMLRVEAQMPPGMTLTEARATTTATAKGANGDTSEESRPQPMRLKLEVTALNLYIDAHFRNARDGRILGLTPVTLDDEAEIQ